jgi:hypothetical protein
VTTQTVPLRNKTFAKPRVAKVIVALSASVPAIYAVVIVQVIVMLPEVLLNTNTASPAEKAASGIVIEPPEPTSMTLHMSEVANV